MSSGIGYGYTTPMNPQTYQLKKIVPQGEGPGSPLSMRFPKALLKRLDACATATGNTRTEVVMHLLRWALESYETERLREQVP